MKSAMVDEGAAGRLVAREGPARETRQVVMCRDLLTLVSAMVLPRTRLVARSSERGGEEGGDERTAGAAHRRRVGEEQLWGLWVAPACLG